MHDAWYMMHYAQCMIYHAWLMTRDGTSIVEVNQANWAWSLRQRLKWQDRYTHTHTERQRSIENQKDSDFHLENDNLDGQNFSSQLYHRLLWILFLKLEIKYTAKRNISSAMYASSMYKLLNGCTFCTKHWAFGPFSPIPYICKAFHWSSLYEYVIFSVCLHMWNATHLEFIMWNSISSLDRW